MAIEKNSFKVSRFDSEFSPGSRESMSSDEDELPRRGSAVDSDEDDFDDADSGAGSDDFDLLELGETGAEFCQVGNVTCSLPLELFDLPGLEDLLSVDVWNECLTEEEKFGLTKYLPDMDQYTFMLTLKELLEGDNFHFGSPLKKLFDMFKGGLCDPRAALYREGLNFFQKKKHYHIVRKHHNDMITNICQIRDAWMNCRGYSIEEKLRVLTIVKSQKSLGYEKTEDLETESSGREESIDELRDRRGGRKASQRVRRYSAYEVDPNLDFPSRGHSPAVYGKQNPKGILKTAGQIAPSAKGFMGRLPSGYTGLDMDTGLYSTSGTLTRQKYDSGPALRTRDRMRIDDDIGDPLFGMGALPDHNVARGGIMDNSGGMRSGRKHEYLRDEELSSDSLMGMRMPFKSSSQAYGRNRNPNQQSEMKVYGTKAPNVRPTHDFVKKGKYPEYAQPYELCPQPPLKGSHGDLSDRSDLYRNRKRHEEDLSMDSSLKYGGDWSNACKKWKTGMESPDHGLKSYKASSPHINDRFLPTEFSVKPSKEKIRGNFVRNGGLDMAPQRGGRVFMKSEDTESDSSDEYDDECSNSLTRSKLGYSGGGLNGPQSTLKNGKAKTVVKDMQENDGSPYSSKKMGSSREHSLMLGVDNRSLKAKQKGKMRDSSPLHNNPVTGVLEDNDRKQIYRSGKNGQVRGEHGEKSHRSSQKTYAADRKQKRLDEENYSFEPRLLPDDNNQGRLVRKGQSTDAHANDQSAKSDAALMGCNSVSKKRKAKEVVMEMEGREKDGNPQRQIDNSTSSKRKGKRKAETEADSPDKEASKPSIAELAETDIEMETKPQKKTFTLITPTVHTGFSFSIIHLLSAVRMAMISMIPEDSLEVGKPTEEKEKNECGLNGVPLTENVDGDKPDHLRQVNLPLLTVLEIVNRVRSNPGDPCILETQEPLQDLVRGILKICSSKTAPLGAKGWKTLVAYEKSSKCWSWVGPVSPSSTDHDTVEEVTSPEAWGLPHKMLVKLVDSFANWLKSGQETLQQIGSLPAPPISLMQCNLDEKERFKDLRAQKSLNTISPSSEEVRAYFQREELLRYSIPDRAFSYTAADGKKSIVAPLRRCGGKPTSKARDHFMLRRDRPPHVTILCLVRDAAARLPGNIGTRADVCTLIKDSQYVVDTVTDAQINQVVSGALDRLHYERDPCVQFDGERKLWVYLHRDREEEDFEDDGTSSTKKWKRQKKDPAEQSEQGGVTVAYHPTGDQSGFELGSDPNAEPTCPDDDKKEEILGSDVRQNVEENVDSSPDSEQGNMHDGQEIGWGDIGLNSIGENKVLCQENSTNEDFDDEAFGRGGPDGLLSANLL